MSTLNKKILVVDDDAVVLKAMTIMLSGAGYQVIAASDGTSAVAAARQEKPDAIVLDLNFPDDFGTVPWDGYRIMQWLQRLGEVAKTPIIVVSSSNPEQVGDRVRKAGAAAFFRKPVDHAELQEELQRLLTEETAPAT